MSRGFALIAATIITALLLSMGLFFVSSSATDLRIARAHAATTRAYYLAEAATALFIYDIEHTQSSINRFRNGNLNENNSTLTRNDLFVSGDTISVYGESTANGEATIHARANTPVDSAQAVRRIARDVSRALGDSITDFAMLSGASGNDIDIEMNVAIAGGIIQSNDDIDIQNGFTLTVENGEVWAEDEIRIEQGGTLALINSEQQEGVLALELPAIDFDSASPTSWRSQATEVMTPSQFNALPDGTILNGIIFVNGSPQDLQQNLTVNGVLVINGSFEIEHPGFLEINAVEGSPSGLLIHNRLEIESNVSIEGLVYASNRLEIEYDHDDTEGILMVEIQGGLMARVFTIEHDIDGPTDIRLTHDPELIGLVLDEEFSTDSPTINVGHWEEEY